MGNSERCHERFWHPTQTAPVVFVYDRRCMNENTPAVLSSDIWQRHVTEIMLTNKQTELLAQRNSLVIDMQTFTVPPCAAPSVVSLMKHVPFSCRFISQSIHITLNKPLFRFHKQQKSLCDRKRCSFLLQYPWLTLRWNCCIHFNAFLRERQSHVVAQQWLYCRMQAL